MSIKALVVMCFALAQAESITPVLRVLQMMQEMKQKSLDEKDAEIVTFKKFSQFCKDTDAAKSDAMADAQARINKLSADIQKYNAESMTLGGEITALDALIDTEANDKVVAKANREHDHAHYLETHAAFEDNIGDLAIGIGQLNSMMSGTKAASLIQNMVSKPHVTAGVRRALNAFLEKSSTTDLLEVSAPEGAKFESQSGGIVDVMGELKSKVEDEKDDLERTESNQEHSYQMISQTLTDQIEDHTSARNSKAITKKQRESQSAMAQQDLDQTKNTKGEDEKYLQDLRTTCQSKSEDYESRQQIRSGEIVALNKAIEIISSGSVAGNSEKHLPQLMQTGRSTLAQLRNLERRPSQSAVASFLAAQGKRMNSRVLVMLALRASEDPFSKVKNMIQDMVDKLMTEANEEAEHKGFCDTELGTNEMTRNKKSTRVSELTANSEEMTAQIERLTAEITDLLAQVNDLDTAVSEATAIRSEEKAKNKIAVADAGVAIAAVNQAVAVLTQYYESAAGATALAQVSRDVADDMPATFDKPYAGQQSASTGVIGMLEVILSDFERLEMTTNQSEASSQAEFERFTTESAQDRAVKLKQAQLKTDDKTQAEIDLAATRKDLMSTQSELDAATEYFEKLKPSCVEAGVSYEDRVLRRKEEIASLNEALNILNEEFM